ncbi:MAG: helix-turn-helix domain-containing protein [Pseudomonadota bacterium]
MVKKIMYLETIEQVRALMEPSRERILRELGGGATTAKEIAQAMGQSVPRIHYHLKELKIHGLIRATKKVQKGNLTETHYEPAARAFRSKTSLEDALRNSPESYRDVLTRALLLGLTSLEDRVVEVVNLIEESDPETFQEAIRPSLLENGLNAEMTDLFLTQEEYEAFHADYQALITRYKKNRKSRKRRAVEMFWMSLPDAEALKAGPL